MFNSSGIFLEDGKNLFRDFWSPFSISFIYFFARQNIIFKRNQLSVVPARDSAGGGFISRRGRRPAETLAAPARRAPRRARAGPRRRRRA